MESETVNSKRGRKISSCRYCSANVGSLRNIFSVYSWKSSEEVYSKIISDTFNVAVVSMEAKLDTSSEICETCVGRLRDALEFKRLVQNVEETLQQHLQMNSLDVISEAQSEREVDIEVKEEMDSLTYHGSPAFEDLPICQELEIRGKTTRSRAMRKTRTAKTTGLKQDDAGKDAVENILPGRNNDNVADDVVRKNSIALLRHSTAYPFQPTKRSFRCCFCPYTPPGYDPTHFRQHMDTKHAHVDKSTCLKHYNESMRRVDITNLKCIDCDKEFLNIEDMARHLVEVHKRDIDLSQSMGLVPIRLQSDKFACCICSKSYTTLHQLSRHTGTHFYRNICYKCGRNFETLKGLKKHVIFTHSKHKFLCQKCKTPFADLKSKKEHLRNSAKCQSFKCKLCNETFLCLETQQAHSVKTHGETKVTYPCPECGEIFEKRIRRYLHFKMAHTDDFKCSYCGTKFSNNRCLRDHIARIHTLERKYKCSVCDKTFIDARTLRTHSFIHDASKKQPCPVCNRAFTMKIRLKYHVQKYHPDVFSTIFSMPLKDTKIVVE